MATIKIKRKTTTGGSAPTTLGEISCNTADKELFVGDGSGTIKFVDDAAVDTKITSALTSAFTYKGTVAGNAQASTDTASNATALIPGAAGKTAIGKGLDAEFAQTKFLITLSGEYGNVANITLQANQSSDEVTLSENSLTINTTAGTVGDLKAKSFPGIVIDDTYEAGVSDADLLVNLSGTSTSDASSPAVSPKNGDYYKITTAGYVKKNGAADTAAFFVNVDDSIVFNGTDWDKIDNTNSGVTAEAGDDLTVTGSTDAGFVVGFSSNAALDQSTQSVDGGTY